MPVLLADQLYPRFVLRDYPPSSITVCVTSDYLRPGYSAVKRDFTIRCAKQYASDNGYKFAIKQSVPKRDCIFDNNGTNPSFPQRVALHIVTTHNPGGNVRFAAFYREWQRVYLGKSFLTSTDVDNRKSAADAMKNLGMVDMVDVDLYKRIAQGRKYALTQLQKFIREQLDGNKFGPYQDVVLFNKEGAEVLTPHSCLSAALNTGLILQTEIIAALMKRGAAYMQRPSVEAFIRQLAWRNYMWEIWLNRDKLVARNLNRGVSLWSIELPIQTMTAMKSAMQTGYANHIARLMIIGAWMVMKKVKPKDAYDWFLNYFIDSYDWVMYGNVYGMLYGELGIMTRQYVCSSNYIKRMTNVKGDYEMWDKAYRAYS